MLCWSTFSLILCQANKKCIVGKNTTYVGNSYKKSHNSNLEKLSELSKTQDIITMINDDDTYRDKTTFSFSENFRKEFT